VGCQSKKPATKEQEYSTGLGAVQQGHAGAANRLWTCGGNAVVSVIFGIDWIANQIIDWIDGCIIKEWTKWVAEGIGI